MSSELEATRFDAAKKDKERKKERRKERKKERKKERISK